MPVPTLPTFFSCHIGKWLGNKTIDSILISYDTEYAYVAGYFLSYFDDIYIHDGVLDTTSLLPTAASRPYPSNNYIFIDSMPTQLCWSGDSLTQNFEVYLGTDLMLTDDDFMVTQADTFINLPGLDWNTKYYWRIDATNYFGATKGQTWNFTFNSKVNSGYELTGQDVPTIYPNPVINGQIQIKFGKYGNGFTGSIYLQDLNERIWRDLRIHKESEISFSVDDLASGIYILILDTRTRVYRFKILIL
jgi:hypothetical protein